MTHDAEWHAMKAEELTARADLLSEEPSWDQPAARAKLDDLRHAASAHLRLAKLMAHEPADQCASLRGEPTENCQDKNCLRRIFRGRGEVCFL